MAVVIFVEGEEISPNFPLLINYFQTSNLIIIKSICFLIGAVNILLGTVLIEYAILYVPVIIAFQLLDYGLILSCVKAIYEVITLNNSLDYMKPTSIITAFLFTTLVSLNAIHYRFLSSDIT